jgi:hypothetical protein
MKRTVAILGRCSQNVGTWRIHVSEVGRMIMRWSYVGIWVASEVWRRVILGQGHRKVEWGEKRMRKAEVEFEKDGKKHGVRVSKQIGVECKPSEPCARPGSGGEIEVKGCELSEEEGVVKSWESELGVNRHDKEESGPVGVTLERKWILFFG